MRRSGINRPAPSVCRRLSTFQAPTLPRHSHESHYFGFVLSGSYKESYDRKVRSCEPLMILYHPAGELHAQSFDQTAVDLFRIEVRPTRLRYPTHPDLLIQARDFRGGAPVGLAEQGCIRSFRRPMRCPTWRLRVSASNSSRALARESERRAKTSSSTGALAGSGA